MWLLPVGILITLVLLLIPHMTNTPSKSFSYSKFLSEVDAGDVHTASINPTGAITGTLKGGDNTPARSRRPSRTTSWHPR
jgi:ATP-dependent Zn protease